MTRTINARFFTNISKKMKKWDIRYDGWEAGILDVFDKEYSETEQRFRLITHKPILDVNKLNSRLKIISVQVKDHTYYSNKILSEGQSYYYLYKMRGLEK